MHRVISLAALSVWLVVSCGCGSKPANTGNPDPGPGGNASKETGQTKESGQPNAQPKQATITEPRATVSTGLSGTSIAITPDGKLAVVHGRGKNKNLQVWDLAKKEKIATLDNDTQGNRAKQVAIAPDGKMVACQLLYGEVPIKEVATGKKLRELHDSQLSGMYFSPTWDVTLIKASSLIRVYDIASGNKLREWPTEADRYASRDFRLTDVSGQVVKDIIA